MARTIALSHDGSADMVKSAELLRQSLAQQASSSGAWRVFPCVCSDALSFARHVLLVDSPWGRREEAFFDDAVTRADVVIVMLTPDWCASSSGRSDLNATQGRRLSAHESGRVKPWQQGSPVVLILGFKGVDWSAGSVKQLVDINPTVQHEAESLCLGDVQASLFLLYRLIAQI